MDLKGKRIILASGSPRRRELLAGLGIEFTVDTGNSFEERFDPDTPHEVIPAMMSEGKSHGFHRKLKDNEILITSDTMVLCHSAGPYGSPILGKPKNRQDAINMLKRLSDTDHEVVTAVTMRDKDKTVTKCDSTIVTFKKLTDEEIEHYVDVYKPYDKAGAYGIQEWIGFIGITGIKGSYFNVVGFPTHLVYDMLLEFL